MTPQPPPPSFAALATTRAKQGDMEDQPEMSAIERLAEIRARKREFYIKSAVRRGKWMKDAGGKGQHGNGPMLTDETELIIDRYSASNRSRATPDSPIRLHDDAGAAAHNVVETKEARTMESRQRSNASEVSVRQGTETQRSTNVPRFRSAKPSTTSPLLPIIVPPPASSQTQVMATPTGNVTANDAAEGMNSHISPTSTPRASSRRPTSYLRPTPDGARRPSPRRPSPRRPFRAQKMDHAALGAANQAEIAKLRNSKRPESTARKPLITNLTLNDTDISNSNSKPKTTAATSPKATGVVANTRATKPKTPTSGLKSPAIFHTKARGQSRVSGLTSIATTTVKATSRCGPTADAKAASKKAEHHTPVIEGTKPATKTIDIDANDAPADTNMAPADSVAKKPTANVNNQTAQLSAKPRISFLPIASAKRQDSSEEYSDSVNPGDHDHDHDLSIPEFRAPDAIEVPEKTTHTDSDDSRTVVSEMTEHTNLPSSANGSGLDVQQRRLKMEMDRNGLSYNSAHHPILLVDVDSSHFSSTRFLTSVQEDPSEINPGDSASQHIQQLPPRSPNKASRSRNTRHRIIDIAPKIGRNHNMQRLGRTQNELQTQAQPPVASSVMSPSSESSVANSNDFATPRQAPVSTLAPTATNAHPHASSAAKTPEMLTDSLSAESLHRPPIRMRHGLPFEQNDFHPDEETVDSWRDSTNWRLSDSASILSAETTRTTHTSKTPSMRTTGMAGPRMNSTSMVHRMKNSNIRLHRAVIPTESVCMKTPVVSNKTGDVAQVDPISDSRSSSDAIVITHNTDGSNTDTHTVTTTTTKASDVGMESTRLDQPTAVTNNVLSACVGAGAAAAVAVTGNVAAMTAFDVTDTPVHGIDDISKDMNAVTSGPDGTRTAPSTTTPTDQKSRAHGLEPSEHRGDLDLWIEDSAGVKTNTSNLNNATTNSHPKVELKSDGGLEQSAAGLPNSQKSTVDCAADGTPQPSVMPTPTLTLTPTPYASSPTNANASHSRGHIVMGRDPDECVGGPLQGPPTPRQDPPSPITHQPINIFDRLKETLSGDGNLIIDTTQIAEADVVVDQGSMEDENQEAREDGETDAPQHKQQEETTQTAAPASVDERETGVRAVEVESHAATDKERLAKVETNATNGPQASHTIKESVSNTTTVSAASTAASATAVATSAAAITAIAAAITGATTSDKKKPTAASGEETGNSTALIGERLLDLVEDGLGRDGRQTTMDSHSTTTSATKDSMMISSASKSTTAMTSVQMPHKQHHNISTSMATDPSNGIVPWMRSDPATPIMIASNPNMSTRTTAASTQPPTASQFHPLARTFFTSQQQEMQGWFAATMAGATSTTTTTITETVSRNDGETATKKNPQQQLKQDEVKANDVTSNSNTNSDDSNFFTSSYTYLQSIANNLPNFGLSENEVGGMMGVLDRDLDATSKQVPERQDDLLIFLGEELEKSACGLDRNAIPENTAVPMPQQRLISCAQPPACTANDSDVVTVQPNQVRYYHSEYDHRQHDEQYGYTYHRQQVMPSPQHNYEHGDGRNFAMQHAHANQLYESQLRQEQPQQHSVHVPLDENQGHGAVPAPPTPKQQQQSPSP